MKRKSGHKSSEAYQKDQVLERTAQFGAVPPSPTRIGNPHTHRERDKKLVPWPGDSVVIVSFQHKTDKGRENWFFRRRLPETWHFRFFFSFSEIVHPFCGFQKSLQLTLTLRRHRSFFYVTKNTTSQRACPIRPRAASRLTRFFSQTIYNQNNRVE